MFPRILAFFFMIIFQLRAFGGPGDKILNTPRKYLNEPDGQLLPNGSAIANADEKNAWVVASDRINNKSYIGPDGSSMKQKLKFMDKFFVAGESGDYLHLYKYADGIKDIRGRLNTSAVDCGWARKNTLLLWQKCLISNERRLSRKALPIIQKATLSKNLSSYINDANKLKIFNDPEMTIEGSNAISMFQFLYIYKEEGNAILVGKGSETKAYNMENSILGWVSKDIVRVWDDRVCLQPNWEEAAVAERQGAGIKASLFIKNEDAAGWAKTGKGISEPVWDDDTYEAAWLPTRKRYPVLQDANGLISTGYITEIVDASGQTQVDVEEAAKFSKEAVELTDNIRQINLIFVVDGGSGMTEYLNTITKSIEKVAGRNSANAVNRIKYGAVVYRDYGDVACGQDISYAKSELTQTSANIIDFINSQTTVKGCKSGNKAVNLGLYQALRMLSDAKKKNQTNFIILLGGASGNDANDAKYGDKKISGMIADTKTNFCAFQVVMATAPEYAFFTKRYAGIMDESCKISYSNNVEKWKGAPPPRPVFNLSGMNNTYFEDYPSTSDLQAMISFAKYGGSLSIEDIYNGLDSLMKFTDEDIERKISNINTKAEGMGLKNIKMDASMIRYFNSLGESMNNQDIIKKYLDKKFQFFVPAITAVTVKGLKYPVFKRVIFASEDEVQNLSESLNKLRNEGVSTTDIRGKMKDTYVDLLALYLGDTKAKQAIENEGISIEEIFARYVSGIHSKNPLMQYAVRDFQNPKKVPDDDIYKLQKHLRTCYENLSQMRNDPNLTMKAAYGGPYHWIPEELLP